MNDGAHPGPCIEFCDVAYSYADDASFALTHVNFSISSGEFVCIVGANGAGKSTLAKLGCGLLAPTAGIVRIDGRDTSDAAEAAQARGSVGLVQQNPDDQLVCTIVEEDVAFGPENLGLPRDEIRTRVDESLRAVGMDGFQKRDVNTLSGGQKQLVAFAGALALRPRALILDEATSMLDPRGRQTVMALCRDLARADIAVIAITHLMDEAAAADRVIVLDNGNDAAHAGARIALDGAPAYVLTRTDDLARLGLEAPHACQLAAALQQRGIPVTATIDETGLEDELCALLSRA